LVEIAVRVRGQARKEEVVPRHKIKQRW